MSRTFILQIIGRFSGYDELVIKIGDETITTRLVSEAIKKSIREDAEIILYTPESLITSIIDDTEQALNYLRETHLLEKLFEEKIRENNLLEEDFKVRIIKSAGLYHERKNNYKLYFNNNLDSIITYSFIDLLKLGDANIIADISTGQNFYVIALIEALRHLLVYRKLENVFDKEHKTRFRLSTIAPVIQSVERASTPQLLNFSEIDVKVFFEYPLKTTATQNRKTSVSIGDFISKELSKEERGKLIEKLRLVEEFKRDFSIVEELLQLCRVSFNALKYNSPLCFYESEIINLEQSYVEEASNLLVGILEYIEEKREISREADNTVIIRRIPVSRPTIINTFLTIALSKSITENLGQLNTKRNPKLKELEETFKKIYNKLGLQLNLTFLQKEIDNIMKASANLEDGEEKLYIELLEEKPGGAQDPRRNFFAHAGLTYDTVLVKRELGEVKVRYTRDQYKTIRDYLLSPL